MLYRTQYMKRKFGTGGYGAIAGMVGSAVDSLTPENQYGRKSVAATTFKGLTTGASMGAQFGPWGAAGGAVIGGVTGLISGKNAKRKENVMLNAEEMQRKQMEQNEMGAAIQADPSLYQGYRDGQYMKTGGKLKPLVKPAASSIDTVRPPGAPSLFKASMAEMIRDQKAKAALQKARDNAPVLKQAPDTRDEFEKRYGMTRMQYMKRKFQGTLTPQTEERIQKRINNEGNTAIQGVTNLTQFVPGPIGWVSAVAGMALGARDAVEDFGKGDNVNGTLDVVGALPWIPGAKQMGILGKAAKKYARARAASNAGNATGFAADYTNNFGQGDADEYAMGGSLKPISSDGVDVQGASHAQGGVQLPQAEVEGGETIKDDYVFSKQLGFAQLHRPIMRAKGKIEAKPATRERMNSIKLLNEKEGMLEKAQEFFKQKYGYQ